MKGAERLVQTASAAGVAVCFANPGTTELDLVAALDGAPIRPLLCPFEGVATGAADGYGRMARKPALTLTHLGPSFANGIANLHNARRARSPIVNIVGDHPAWLRARDPPLACEIASLAQPVSAWVRTVASAGTIAADVGDAVAAASAGSGQIATLIVPADCQWDEAPDGAARPRPLVPAPPRLPKARRIAEVASALRAGRAALLVGGDGLRGLGAVDRIRAATGCRVFCETFPARLDQGGGSAPIERFPYVPALAAAQLRGLAYLALAGASRPVPYFAQRDSPPSLLPAALAIGVLAGEGDDAMAALAALADELAGRPAAGPSAATPSPAPPRVASVPAGERLTPATALTTVAALQPEGTIFVDEGVSSSGDYLRIAAACRPHSYLALTGGATGLGLSAAIGAAVACPQRQVIAYVGDGSAMYTVQALWTQARERLAIVNLICANDGYRILQLEMQLRTGPVGEAGRRLTELSSPAIDWVGLARSLGVAAVRVESVDELRDALVIAFGEGGPHLIEMRLR